MSTGVLEKIIAFSNGELDELPDGLERPGFFCDESWRWKTKMVYSESTGKMTTTSISESTGKIFWMPNSMRRMTPLELN